MATTNGTTPQTTPIKAPTAALQAEATRVPSAAPNGPKQEPRTCPVTKDEFMHHAKPSITLGNSDGMQLVGTLKEFSTGSFGYYGQGKVLVNVNGKPVWLQAAITLTAIGSKTARK